MVPSSFRRADILVVNVKYVSLWWTDTTTVGLVHQRWGISVQYSGISHEVETSSVLSAVCLWKM